MLRRAFKFSILVGIFIVGSLTAAFAEEGRDYSKTLLGVNPDGSSTYQWTSHYPRIWDGNNWVNHLVNETPDILEVRTANISFDFDKNTCAFKLYDPTDQSVAIPSYSSTLLIDGLVIPSPTCNFTNLVYDTNGLSFTAERNQFNTEYVINSAGSVEWTYTTPIQTGISRVFEIQEVCEGCPIVTPDSETANLGVYHYDSKNYIHGALSELAYSSCTPRAGLDCPHNNPRFTATYSQTIANGERLDIDPTFGWNSPTVISVQGGPNASGSGCPAGDDKASLLTIYQDRAATVSDCRLHVYRWDITSIDDSATIDDVQFRIDIDSKHAETNENCSINDVLGDDPNTMAASDLQVDALNGTKYVNALVECDLVPTLQDTHDLGATADADLQSQLDDENWFAISLYHDPWTRNTSFQQSDLTDPELLVTYTEHLPPVFEISQTVSNVGDIFRISGTVDVLEVSPFANITGIVVRNNGTIINTNSTIQNSTSGTPYSINYGPIWSQILVDTPRNITTTVSVQHNEFGTTLNETKTYLSREYDPDYFTAQVPSEGDVNYTKPLTGGIKVNRDKSGATFQIECSCLDYSDAFTNTTEASEWNNATSTGYYQYTCSQGTAITACYNDNLLFITSYPANSSTILVSGTAIFDQLGGFLGAPSALLIVLAIYSLGTGRNFPIIAVIAMAAMGLMGVLGLLVLNPAIWGVLIVLTGITIFNQRKFF